MVPKHLHTASASNRFAQNFTHRRGRFAQNSKTTEAQLASKHLCGCGTRPATINEGLFILGSHLQVVWSPLQESSIRIHVMCSTQVVFGTVWIHLNSEES